MLLIINVRKILLRRKALLFWRLNNVWLVAGGSGRHYQIEILLILISDIRYQIWRTWTLSPDSSPLHLSCSSPWRCSSSPVASSLWRTRPPVCFSLWRILHTRSPPPSQTGSPLYKYDNNISQKSPSHLFKDRFIFVPQFSSPTHSTGRMVYKNVSLLTDRHKYRLLCDPQPPQWHGISFNSNWPHPLPDDVDISNIYCLMLSLCAVTYESKFQATNSQGQFCCLLSQCLSLIFRILLTTTYKSGGNIEMRSFNSTFSWLAVQFWKIHCWMI